MTNQTALFMNQSRAALRQLLGLQRPLGEAVVRAYADDPLYAIHLWTARAEPVFLDALLAAPPAAAAADSPPAPDDIERIRGAIGSLLRWSRGGFKTVDDEAYEARMAVCRACPNLVPPASMLERIADRALAPAGASDDEPSMCRLCGCRMATKARMETSSCPDRDPEDPDRSRWGDPYRPHAPRPGAQPAAASAQPQPA